MTTIEKLKISAFDTAINVLRFSKEQWLEESPGETKQERIVKLLKETANTIKELE